MTHPMDLTFVELFAGVGGMSMGLEDAGWECLGHAEWEAFPRRVLKARWSGVPLWGDVSKLNGHDIVQEVGPFTMLTFGAPCQDFSIAGKRDGMDGERSVLVLDALRIWEESGAPLALYENVVGMLSSNQGADFASILSVFVGNPVAVPARGWKGGGGVVRGHRGVAAWRVLDAQYFGVPQRRRRVFVLGTRLAGLDPAEILSLLDGVSGHPAPRRTKRQATPADAGAGTTKCDSFTFVMRGRDGHPTPEVSTVAPSLRTPGGGSSHVNVVDALTFDARGNGDGSVVNTMAGDHQNRVTDYTAIILRQREGKPGGGKGPLLSPERSLTLGTANDQVVFPALTMGAHPAAPGLNGQDGHLFAAVLHHAQPGIPRRLTPVECERLMGWPAGWTDVPDEKGKPAPDTARYKACGNGVAAPVAQWIGFRLRAALEGKHPDAYELLPEVTNV